MKSVTLLQGPWNFVPSKSLLLYNIYSLAKLLYLFMVCIIIRVVLIAKQIL